MSLTLNPASAVAQARQRGCLHAPLSSLMVAYLLFARGQLLRLQSPVTLYSLRQKFCTLVLDLKLQW